MKVELQGADGQRHQFERVVLPLPDDLVWRPVVYAFVVWTGPDDFKMISIDEALGLSDAHRRVDAARNKGANCALWRREDNPLERRAMVDNLRRAYDV
jgi:hypothetical protein